MGRLLWGAAAVLGVLGAAALAVAALSDSDLPPSPHLWMEHKEACADCHEVSGEDVEPHGFFVSIPEECWRCHGQEKLGRSHPIDVRPSRSPGNMVVPDDLPLEDGKVSCGTCHQPHMPWLSQDKHLQNQVPKFVQSEGNVKYYSSLFVRKFDPETGFAPLCQSCHENF